MLEQYGLEIDEYIRFLGKSRVNSFYPMEVVSALSFPLDVVIGRLNYLVTGDLLELKYEIKCEECLETIDIVDEYKDFIGKEVYCEDCKDYIVIDQCNIFPLYYFTPQYKELLLKKNRIKSRLKHSKDLALI